MILLIILLILIILILSFVLFVLHYIFNKDNKNIIFSESHSETSVKSPDNYEKNGLKAFVLCSCKKDFKNPPLNFNSQHSCFLVKSIHGSGSDCKFYCIGLGDCAKVCPQQAIEIQNNTAIISDLCCGCGQCIDVCPQSIIKLIPMNTENIVPCKNENSDVLTSCSKIGKAEKPHWPAKKDFKIWTACYKMIKRQK